MKDNESPPKETCPLSYNCISIIEIKNSKITSTYTRDKYSPVLVSILILSP